MNDFRTFNLVCVISIICISRSYCQNEIFGIDMQDVIWHSQPSTFDNCARVRNQASLYGFSIAIDGGKGSLFIGAPGCNGLYECSNYKIRQPCQDISSQIYLTNNPGKVFLNVDVIVYVVIITSDKHKA